MDEAKKRISKFRKNKKTYDCVKKWESDQNYIPIISDDCNLKGGGKEEFNPIFNKIYKSLGNCQNYEDKEESFKSFLLTNFRSYKKMCGGLKDENYKPDSSMMKIFTPSNTTSFKTDGNGAMSSLVHILVIPHPKNRKYNAVSLSSDKNTINYLKLMKCYGLKIAKLQLKTLWNYENVIKMYKKYLNDKKNEEVIRFNELKEWMMQDSDGTLKMKNKTWADSMYKIYDDENTFVKGLDLIKEDAESFAKNIWFWHMKQVKTISNPDFDEFFTIGFHYDPDHSVGYLHMHVMYNHLRTKSWEHNFKKTISIEDTIKALDSMKMVENKKTKKCSIM